MLARSASGLRHLRWAREILGTLRGFAAHPESMSDAQRETLRIEIDRVASLVSELSGAVKPYRDFLERRRTLARGAVRAAEHLGAGGNGLAAPPGAEASASALTTARGAMTGEIDPTRSSLREALGRAVDATRDGLRAMSEALAGKFSPRFVAALYPALTADRSRVLDDGDPDDDSAGA